MKIPECVSQMLLENETILWSGRPEPFSLWDSISKKAFLCCRHIESHDLPSLSRRSWLFNSYRNPCRKNSTPSVPWPQ